MAKLFVVFFTFELIFTMHFFDMISQLAWTWKGSLAGITFVSYFLMYTCNIFIQSPCINKGFLAGIHILFTLRTNSVMNFLDMFFQTRLMAPSAPPLDSAFGDGLLNILT